MKKLLFILLLSPFLAQAHPGIGIVKDSKGNIYYTDLKQVWKITNGHQTVVVPNVHTHELYIDQNDNLYGEGGDYDDKTRKFYHYLWVYRANGQIDTVMGMKEAYVHQDFSLSKDQRGNEYYVKHFLSNPDTTHIYKKAPGGKEILFATGSFKAVTWLHPQANGSLFYILNNTLYRVDTVGNIKLIREGIANPKPSFKFSGNSITIWGVWQDNTNNIYVAVFSDQTVKKIDTQGNLTDVYTSKGEWAPLHGVFDNHNRLWVLESSDRNDVRVTLAEANPMTKPEKKSNLLTYIIVSALVSCIMIVYLMFKYFNLARLKRLT